MSASEEGGYAAAGLEPGTTEEVKEQELKDQQLEEQLEENVASDIKHETQHGPLLHKVIFIITGTAELFVWNAVLSILFDIREQIYPDYPSMTDTLNAVNNLTNLGVAVYCVWSGAMNQFWILLSGATLAASCIALAMVTQWAKGIQGVVWYHLILLVAGAACGMYQTGGFGLASALRVPMTGYVSTGQGVSGVATWVLWLGISNSPLKIKPAMWTLMACGATVLAFSAVCYYILLKQEDVNERVKRIQKNLKEEARNPDAPGYLFLFKQCWRHIFTIWWNMLLTLWVFPNLGPLGWGDGDFTTYVMGAFQIGDLIGRYSPNLMKFIVPSPKVLFWIVIGRTIIVPLGILSYCYPDNAFLGNNAWHFIFMCLIAMTNGWICSSVFMNTPYVIKSETWKSRVSSMVVCGLLLGIGCGLWIARIFTALKK